MFQGKNCFVILRRKIIELHELLMYKFGYLWVYNDIYSSVGGTNMGKKQNKVLWWEENSILITLISAIIFFAPYFRGLFFEKEFFFFHMLTAITFFIFAYKKIDNGSFTFFKYYPDFFAVGLVIAYVAAVFFAVEMRLAAAESIKMLTYLLIYFMLTYSVSNVREIKWYLQVIYLSGVIVAVLGLGTAFGTFSYHDAVIDGIILSTLQYKNTLGIFMVVMNLIGFYLWGSEENVLKKIFYGMTNYLIFITLLGSQSRGAWLVYPLIILIMFLVSENKVRKEMIKLYIWHFFALAITITQLFKAISTGATAGWGYLLIGFLVVAGLEFGSQKIPVKTSININYRMVIGIFAASLMAILLFVVFKSDTAITVAKSILPEQLGARVESINFNVHQVQERLAFYKDGLKIFNEHPIIGIGGKGWATVYHKYQSYGYSSRELHSYFMKVLVETGVTGFMMLIGFILSIIYMGIKCIFVKRDHHDKNLIGVIVTSFLALILHSGIDFNLSLGAVAILLWSLAGLSIAYYRITALHSSGIRINISLGKQLQFSIAAVLCLILILVPSTFAMGEKYARKAIQEMNVGNLAQAEKYFKQAETFDPLTGKYKIYLGEIAFEQGKRSNQRDNQYFQTALTEIDEAIKLNYYNHISHYIKGKMLVNMGRFDEAVTEVETGSSLRPYINESYEEMARIYTNLGRYLISKKDYQKGIEYLQKASQVENSLKDTMNQVDEEYLRLWIVVPKLTITPKLAFYLGEANCLLGNYEKAIEHFEVAATVEDIRSDALLWRGVCLKEMKQFDLSKQTLSDAFKLNPKLTQELGIINNQILLIKEVK